MRYKKAIIAAAALMCAVSAVSCGSTVEKNSNSVVLELATTTSASTDTSEGTADASSTEASAVTTGETDETTETTTVTEYSVELTITTSAEEETTAEATEAPQPQSVVFSFDTLNTDASRYIEALGTPSSVQNAQGCLSNGADQKVYSYPGLTISCYISGNFEIIYDVTITDSKYAVSNGIAVGSSRADVEAALGTGEESGGYVIYTGSIGEMDIKYSGDTVSEIIFYMPV